MNASHAVNDHSLSSVVFEELKNAGLPPERLSEAKIFCQAFFARIAGSDADLHPPAQWV